VTGRRPRVASIPFGGCESSADARRLSPAARASPRTVTFSPSELPCTASSGLLVPRSLHVLAGSSVAFRPRPFGSVDPQPAEPRGLPRRTARRATPCHHVPSDAFAHGVAPVPGYGRRARSRCTAHRSARGSSSREVLPGFRPLQRSRPVVSTWLTRGYRTRYVPSPGILTLLTVLSTTCPAGLFHPTGALGVRPFRACLLEEPWRLSTPDALLTFPTSTLPPPHATPFRERAAGPDHAGSPQVMMEASAARLQGVQLPSRGRSVAQRFRPRGGRSSLGLPPLQGPHSTRLTQRLTPRNSRGLRTPDLPTTFAADSSVALPSGASRHTG